jgi:signal transduction histidine kinase
MARSATSMTASELGRLPLTSTGDELEELGLAFNGLLDRLNGAFVRLNEAYEQRSRFAGDASHQLRTPLAALLGQIQVARRHDRSAEEYRRVLDLVQVEGMRLRRIIESLLTLVQPERADVEIPKLDLRSWTSDHLQRFSSHSRASDLRVELGDDPLIVQADPSLVAQILDNLLENAFKYSTEGSPVLVRAGWERDSVVLGVEDRGWGISPEDSAHVFEPFFRTEQARRSARAGVGLGLAVAHRIASSLGGSIEFRSESRAGSCFLLRLPGMTAHHVDEGGIERRPLSNSVLAPP